MGKYFGTDGFRGEAGTVLTAERAFRAGKYIGYVSHLKQGRIVIGEDTRISGSMLRCAFAAGVMSQGADIYMMGTAATPAVSFAASKGGFDYGVMISASHNPFSDNGIKIMNGLGEKLSDEETALIDHFLEDSSMDPQEARGADIGRAVRYPEGLSLYKDHLFGIAVTEGLSGADISVALDLSCGAACSSAQDIFRKLCPGLFVTGEKPDGMNINMNCGSTHMEHIGSFVKEMKADIGFAYDGDADRCLAVDENGRVIDGDRLIFAAAKDMKERGLLSGNGVAVTKMTNLAALKAFEKEKIGYEITDVGDKYIYERMKEKGLSLGGEQSGHVIFMNHARTGDGILTSIMILAAFLRCRKSRPGTPASGFFSSFEPFPQILLNIIVTDREGAMEDPAVLRAQREAAESLGGDGRVLLRPSGTEPCIRVMAEAATMEKCRLAANMVVSAIEKAGWT